ncbi:uncharacterized protein FMAN_12483 [Fusarium mangiferae]|uniref:Uncharacterized protein n=1 Tax=Fusarium mangiferae TaxID=192010 RepID=A0A1L7TTC9_FUSMA|nr:uncharacterized protein FMAN_12483 [Fusarium mangiferae]CVK98511.1 uncharacterized protein FMAN_12483 [Fusarium mangiferae]
MQKPNKNRYERCSRGGECTVIPPDARGVCLFFWTYHRAHPNVNDEDDEDDENETNPSDIAKEKGNRRIAAKTILKGYFTGGTESIPPERGKKLMCYFDRVAWIYLT